MNLDAVNWGAWIPALIFIVPPVCVLLGWTIGWLHGWDAGVKFARSIIREWIEDHQR